MPIVTILVCVEFCPNLLLKLGEFEPACRCKFSNGSRSKATAEIQNASEKRVQALVHQLTFIAENEPEKLILAMSKGTPFQI